MTSLTVGSSEICILSFISCIPTGCALPILHSIGNILIGACGAPPIRIAYSFIKIFKITGEKREDVYLNEILDQDIVAVFPQ